MKQAQAMDYVRKLLTGVQRARSVSTEGIENIVLGMGGELSETQQRVIIDLLEDLTPWLYGAKGNALLNGLALVEGRGSVTGMEFYNFMTIIHHIEPFIATTAGILTETSFPEPEAGWCLGFSQ